MFVVCPLRIVISVNVSTALAGVCDNVGDGTG